MRTSKKTVVKRVDPYVAELHMILVEQTRQREVRARARASLEEENRKSAEAFAPLLRIIMAARRIPAVGRGVRDLHELPRSAYSMRFEDHIHSLGPSSVQFYGQNGDDNGFYISANPAGNLYIRREGKADSEGLWVAQKQLVEYIAERVIPLSDSP